MKERIFRELQNIPGKIGFHYKNLVTQEIWNFQNDMPLMAASVIKIPVLAEAFYEIANGMLDKNATYHIKEEDKLPSCGALSYMHTGLEVTIEDLYTLMIILSDNTATNLLIRRFGMETINQRMRHLGLHKTTINRYLFDSRSAAKGLENYITAAEIADLLERMYLGTLFTKDASADMLRILADQRLNGKMPFFLHNQGVKIAHKTGEDDGITHDVGIVFAKQPFIVCFCSNETDVPLFEQFIQRTTQTLYQMQEE